MTICIYVYIHIHIYVYIYVQFIDNLEKDEEGDDDYDEYIRDVNNRNGEDDADYDDEVCMYI
jgi:hypothetical protein